MLLRITVRVSLAQGRLKRRGYELPINHPRYEIVAEDCPQWPVSGEPSTLHDVERVESIQESRIEEHKVNA